ncbi:hypothetical protein [Pseudomonas putida]
MDWVTPQDGEGPIYQGL